MDMNVDNALSVTRTHMEHAVAAMQESFGAVRTGKASPALVENLMIDYYGTSTKLRDIAGITTPEPRLLVIQPWDQSAVASIEKAIQASSLGISPVSDGRIVRLPIPELSEERRNDLAKLVKNRAEEARVEVRNVRREANDFCRRAEKRSEITEDDLTDLEKDIQKLTDDTIEEINESLATKSQELLQI